MIVDVHTHTPYGRHAAPAGRPPARPDRADSGAVSPDEFLRAMEPVDRVIVFGIAPLPPGDPAAPAVPQEASAPTARDGNEATAALVRTKPDKLIGFMSVHPRDPHLFEEIDRSVGDLGLRGIKLGPNYQNFDPLGADAFRLYRRAQELRLPILFHQGTSAMAAADLDYAHPRHMDRVATAFPDLKIVLAHMAHPWQVDCIAVIRKHPNVWADISGLHYRAWSYYNCLRLAAEWSVLPKLLFGSDYPAAASPAETADALTRVNDILDGTRLPRVPVDELQEILHRNSLSLLGLA
ncbi:MAG: FIG00736640: hypothetical protein [uncultured Chloroflexi bacterium]|uniref:Amidohydrolase-related domain-containing protein n=1 Tax=uncultured Chloroflexota bacterium TaxID=166587 RepID=A0A6J4HBX3_9CHLR|nr:MAG: FIG00736640: hypothetical protein [uncultured Chloroflexota bacterium]